MNTKIQVRSGGIEVAKGIASCYALNLLHLGLAWLDLINARGFDARFIFAVRLIVWFGLLQFIYVLPLVFVFAKKRPLQCCQRNAHRCYDKFSFVRSLLGLNKLCYRGSSLEIMT